MPIVLCHVTSCASTRHELFALHDPGCSDAFCDAQLEQGAEVRPPSRVNWMEIE